VRVDIRKTLRSHDREFKLEASFSAEHDRIVVFGPSGSGKSITMQCLAGLLRPDAGRIQIGERILFDSSAGIDVPPQSRNVGFVFQDYALFPHLDVEKNVGFGLRDANDAAARVAQFLTLFELTPLARSFPRNLSGGQRQRVALARALIRQPELLLLDEPLSALDARVRAHLRTEIRQLQRRLQVTTIMVTHDQEEALTMADRIVVMNHGAVEQIGTPAEIYREPATLFVARFVGHMNLLEALADDRPGWLVRWLYSRHPPVPDRLAAAEAYARAEGATSSGRR